MKSNDLRLLKGCCKCVFTFKGPGCYGLLNLILREIGTLGILFILDTSGSVENVHGFSCMCFIGRFIVQLTSLSGKVILVASPQCLWFDKSSVCFNLYSIVSVFIGNVNRLIETHVLK